MRREDDCRICPGLNVTRTVARPQTSPAAFNRTYTYTRTTTSPGYNPTPSRRPVPLRRPDFDATYTSTRSQGGRLGNQTFNLSRSPEGAAGVTFRSQGGLMRTPPSSLGRNISGGSNNTPGRLGVALRYSGSPGGTFNYSRSPAAGRTFVGAMPSSPMSPIRTSGATFGSSHGPTGTFSISRSPVSRNRTYYTTDEDMSRDSLDELTDAEEFGDECEGGGFRFVNPRIVYSPYRPPPPRGPLDFTVISDDITPIGSPHARAMMSPRMITSTPKNAPPDITPEFPDSLNMCGQNEGIAQKIHAMWNPDDTFSRWANIGNWDLDKEIQWKNLLQRLCYEHNCRSMRGSCYVGLEGKLQAAINSLYEPAGFDVGVKMIYELLKRNKDLELVPHLEGMPHEKIGEVILGLNKENNADPNPDPDDGATLSDAEMEMIAATTHMLTPEGTEPIPLKPKYFNMLLEWYIRRHDSEEDSVSASA